MKHRIIQVTIILLVTLLVSCQSTASPTAHRPTELPSGGETPIETVEELRSYKNGVIQVHRTQEGQAVETVGVLLGVIPDLNLQALCFYSNEDVARMREEQDSLELLFTHPVDMAIGQWIAENERSQVPTDERGYRVLSLVRALFILEGDMTGSVLLLDEEGGWSCWAVERNDSIDTGWITTVRP